jgi:hypothetical protein
MPGKRWAQAPENSSVSRGNNEDRFYRVNVCIREQGMKRPSHALEFVHDTTRLFFGGVRQNMKVLASCLNPLHRQCQAKATRRDQQGH